MNFDANAMASGFSGPPDLSLMQVAIYAFIGLIILLFLLTFLAVASLPIFFGTLFAMELGLGIFQAMPDPIGKWVKLSGLVFRSLRRNMLRTSLTYAALFVLTAILAIIYSKVAGLGKLTAEKDGAQMVILTEKYSIPSMMKPSYADDLKRIIREDLPAQYRPDDVDSNFMTWSFVGGTLDQTKMTQENVLFFFALDPSSIESGMMKDQGLNKDDLGEKNWAELLRVMDVVKQDKRHVVIGEDRLKMMNKKVGDEIKVFGTNYKDITFDFKIVGAFPSGTRLSMSAAMRYDYLQSMLNDYKARKGEPHPVADRSLNLVWVRMPNKESYEALAEIVNKPGTFNAPAAKMETFSSVIGSFIEPFKDILWGMKYIIMPAIIGIMCVVVGITITIGVRERWAEMAVMKVLGFQPAQLVTMIISEAMLIGVFGGMLSTWFMYFIYQIGSTIAKGMGTKFAMLEIVNIEPEMLLFGPLLGVAVGFVGAALPSWNARKVKVSEVFAQVA